MIDRICEEKLIEELGKCSKLIKNINQLSEEK